MDFLAHFTYENTHYTNCSFLSDFQLIYNNEVTNSETYIQRHALFKWNLDLDFLAHFTYENTLHIIQIVVFLVTSI